VPGGEFEQTMSRLQIEIDRACDDAGVTAMLACASALADLAWSGPATPTMPL
jgi:hypothetical protein